MDIYPTTLQNLPLELLDRILMKTVVKLVRSTWEDSAYQIRTDIYRHLAIVQSEWYYRLTTRWFRIVLQRELKHFSPLTKYRENPELMKTVDIGHGVWGLALLNRELFIVSFYTVAVFVYDPMSFERLRTIPMEGFAAPRDIVSCQQENCLFMIIESSSSLLCIDRKGKMLKMWQVPYQPNNLSVTPCGHILLTCNAKILIYSSNGNLMQNMSLDANALDMSWQTILLNSGNFFVCQGWMGSKHHRVLKLSPEGSILRSFGSERQHSDSHLSNPVYMAVDRDEMIFVADSGNNRVVLLNRGLVFMKDLISKNDGIIQPYRVLLDEASGLLYVGTNHRQLFSFKVFK